MDGAHNKEFWESCFLYYNSGRITYKLIASFSDSWHWEFIGTRFDCAFFYGWSVAKSSPALCDPMDCSTPAPLSFTISRSLLKLMSVESVFLSNHLILCCPLLLLPSIFPSIRIFTNELVLHMYSEHFKILIPPVLIPMFSMQRVPRCVTSKDLGGICNLGSTDHN